VQMSKVYIEYQSILGDSGSPIFQWKGNYWEQVGSFIFRSYRF
jgi:hypothetical protein